MTDIVVTSDLLISEITRLFTESDVHRIDSSLYNSPEPNTITFEDEYAIITVWAFDSVSALVTEWGAAQDHVVRLLGANIANTDPKSWDGYLVLVAMDGVPEGLVAAIGNIRSDTRRVRKLIITGDDLPTRVSDPLEMTPFIRRALAPILDLQIDSNLGRSDPLKSLPDRLSASLTAASYLSAVISAHEIGVSPLEALHHELTGTSHDEVPS